MESAVSTGGATSFPTVSARPRYETPAREPEAFPTVSIAEVSRRRLYLLIAWAVLLSLGGSIYLGPYFAAWRIREAVALGDADTLHDFVDFEAVRDNLKSELRRTVGASQRAQNRRSADAADGGAETPEPAPDLASQLAVAVGETMIDRFATPGRGGPGAPRRPHHGKGMVRLPRSQRRGGRRVRWRGRGCR